MDNVVARVFEMACRRPQPIESVHDFNRAGANGGQLSYDSCGCEGCAAVRRYVRAKMTLRSVERRFDVSEGVLLGDIGRDKLLLEARRAVAVTRAHKEEVCRQVIPSEESAPFLPRSLYD